LLGGTYLSKSNISSSSGNTTIMAVLPTIGTKQRVDVDNEKL
jgi:hypothetical protein